MENCQKEHWMGMCCCNCTNFKKVMKHPMNKGESKGSISEKFGNVCTYDEDGSMEFVFSDREHGMCEGHSIEEELF
jgi:hypothetical protein